MKRKNEKMRAGRMVVALFALLNLFAPATAPADVGFYCGLPDDSRCEVWTARRDRGAGDVTLASASSPSGDRVFTTGVDNSLGSSANNIVTLAFNGATGALLWERSYGGSGSDTPFSISVSPIAVAGTTAQFYPQQINAITTISLDATTGALRWDARYGLPLDTDTTLASKTMISTAGGRVFVGKSVGKPTVNYDYFVAAYDI